MNKNTAKAIIAAALVCASLTACTQDKNTDVNAPVERDPLNSTITMMPDKAHFTFLEHSQDTPNTITSSDKQTTYISTVSEKVSFVADSRADRQSAKKINEALTLAYDRSKDIHDSLLDALDAYLSKDNADLTVFPWETKVDFSCLRNDGRAISVMETIDSYSAGNLTGTTVFTYNFDPVNGDRISQVFYDVSDEAAFDKADDEMYNKLVAKYGEEVIDYANVASSFVETAQQCWYFTNSGIVVTFYESSIAPSEAGVLEIEYTKEELPEFARKYFN